MQGLLNWGTQSDTLDVESQEVVSGSNTVGKFCIRGRLAQRFESGLGMGGDASLSMQGGAGIARSGSRCVR